MKRSSENPSAPGEKKALSRRQLLKTGGMTAVGGAVAFGVQGLTQARSAAVPETFPKPPFDIRDSVENSQLDSKSIQAKYDAINRMVHLIGDLPFSDLFQMPIPDLVNLIYPRIRDAARYGLIDDPDRVEALADDLAAQAPDKNLYKLFVDDRYTVNTAAFSTLINLRREGVRIPIPAHDASFSSKRQAALDNLLATSGDVTFQGLFVLTRQDVGQAVVDSIAQVKAVQLLAWFDNDRCCDEGGGPIEGTDACIEHEDLFCNLPPPSRAFCSIGSDPCPADVAEFDPNAVG